MLKIKPYLPSYKDSLLVVLRSNTSAYFDPSEESLFSDYLDKEREDYFVVEHHDRIIGCGGINYDHQHQMAIISWDIIAYECHGKGIGGKLLSYRLSHIKRKYPSYNIRVRTAQNTFKFYEKYGFELQYIQKDYWAPGYDLYYMEKINP